MCHQYISISLNFDELHPVLNKCLLMTQVVPSTKCYLYLEFCFVLLLHHCLWQIRSSRESNVEEKETSDTMSDMTRFKSLGKYEDWMFMNPSPTRILGETEEENLKLNSESFFSSYILPIFTPSPSSITSTRVLLSVSPEGRKNKKSYSRLVSRGSSWGQCCR